MLPALGALAVSSDGILTVVGVAAGSVPAGTVKTGAMAVKSDGKLYVVWV